MKRLIMALSLILFLASPLQAANDVDDDHGNIITITTIDGTYFFVTSKYTLIAVPLIINGLYYFDPDSDFRFYAAAGLGAVLVSTKYTFKSKANQEM